MRRSLRNRRAPLMSERPPGRQIGTGEPGRGPDVNRLQAAGNRALTRLLGAARRLDARTRAEMEASFGRPLGDVRIHTGPEAARAAQTLGAKAFTVGHDVVFGKGQYRPETEEGKRLLAHELAHVAQPGARDGLSPTGVSRSDEPAELEAERAANAAVAGVSTSLSRPVAAGTAYRQVDVLPPEVLTGGGLWIVGPDADTVLYHLEDLTGLSLFRDKSGQVYVIGETAPAAPAPKAPAGEKAKPAGKGAAKPAGKGGAKPAGKGTAKEKAAASKAAAPAAPKRSTAAAALIKEVAGQNNVRVVVNAVDFISAGFVGAFDEPKGSGQQQVDVRDLEALEAPPTGVTGSALIHEISEAYFGRQLEREPGLMPFTATVYETAHPMAMEVENKVRRELGLPPREPTDFPMISLPPDRTGSSAPYAISIDAYETYFQVMLLRQDVATGDISIEQTFAVPRTFDPTDPERDWQEIVKGLKFTVRP